MSLQPDQGRRKSLTTGAALELSTRRRRSRQRRAYRISSGTCGTVRTFYSSLRGPIELIHAPPQCPKSSSTVP